MCNKMKLLLVLILLALAPDHALAQTKTYDCNLPASGGVCIDSITAVFGNSDGGASLVVHWHLGPAPYPPSSAADFFQIRYAYPGSPDTQVKLSGGTEGVYNLILDPTADLSGDYTFKVQGCFNGGVFPAGCWGGNQPPWDVEIFALAATAPITSGTAGATIPICPRGLATPNGTCCTNNTFPMKDNTCCPSERVPSLLNLPGQTPMCCPAGDNVGSTLCCPPGQKQNGTTCQKVLTDAPVKLQSGPTAPQPTVPKVLAPSVKPGACDPKQKTPNGTCCAAGTVPQKDNSCCSSGQMTGNHICCPEGQSAGATMCCPAGQHQAGKICTTIGTPPPPKKGTGAKS